MNDTHVPKYDTAEAVDDALSAVKARWDHGEAPYDPDVLAVIRAAEAMREKLYGEEAAAHDAGHSALRDRMDSLLTGVAAALKGEPGPLVMHDWSDLPEVAAEVARRAAAGPPAGAPTAWVELFEGLALLAQHPTDPISPLHCQHDKLTVLADQGKFNSEDIARLAELGFHPDSEGAFYSFKFGSA